MLELVKLGIGPMERDLDFVEGLICRGVTNRACYAYAENLDPMVGEPCFKYPVGIHPISQLFRGVKRIFYLYPSDM